MAEEAHTDVGRRRRKPHAIIVPYPLQGHVIPAVHLAVKLASQGFTITFINTEYIHHKAAAAAASGGGGDVFADVRKSGLDIRYSTVSDGLPVGFDRSLNHDEFMASILHVLPTHVEEVIAGIVVAGEKDGAVVRCLVADTFFVWPSKVAKKFGLVYVSVWTEPALVYTLYHHVHLLRQNGHFGCQDRRKDAIDYIPDTIKELELDTISGLEQDHKAQVYAIGPIFPPGFTTSLVSTSLWFESDCTQWLNTKPPGSVLYVSFGSYAHVEKADLMEIARGLALSKVSFVWVLRDDIVSSDDPDPLPDGFREEVSDRGMIVGWCSQKEVLAHVAVGGFLTHCGWNSILESTWCGVPMLCFPLYTDQFTNRKLVVDDWKNGINLIDQTVVTKEEVCKNIKRLMNERLKDEIKEKVNNVKKILTNTLEPSGSSEQNFNRFVRELNDKII
ncbi:UDP-glycosyltransferase 86A1 [Linum perenne]